MRVTTILVLSAILFLPQIASAGNVTLAWDANTEPELVGYYLCYGATSGQYSTQVDVGNVVSHTVSDLPAGTYYFAVKAYGIEGLESAYSNEVTATIAATDTAPPVISGVSTSGISATGATVSWTTNEASTTQVEYGTTTSYGSSTSLNSSLVTAHSQSLSGLAASTTYHYRVKSRDAAGNLATSGDYTFTTATPPDVTPPTITGVSASGITATGATISWTSNEAADSQVEYGTTTSYGSSTTLNSSLVTSHSQSLSGLTAGTTYHYRVKSRDAAGNLAASADFTFTTSAPPIDIYSGLVAAYAFDEGKGTTSADYSGNGNTATLYSASWRKGKYGQALYFNGNTSYVSAGTAGLPGVGQPKTISFWVYLTTLKTSIQSIVGLGNPSLNASVHYGVKSTLAGLFNPSAQWIAYSRVPSQFVWHHIAYIYDGSKNGIYLNGTLLCSSTIEPAAAPVTAFELARWVGGGSYFKGFIDDVRIFNRALSTEELNLVMQTPVSAQASPAAGESVTALESEPDALPSTKAHARAQSGRAPEIGLDLEQVQNRRRETVRAKSLRIVNPSDQSEEVELKTWIALPGMPPVSLSEEGDDSLQLEAGSDLDFTKLPMLEIASDAVAASGYYGARLLNPITGDILSEALRPFEIGKGSAGLEKPVSPSGLTLEAREKDGQPAYQIRNAGTDPAAAELKLWIETADGGIYPIMAPGADGSFVLPAGASVTVYPMANLQAPAGSYLLKARLLDPSSGDLIAEHEHLR
jgi:hypothetical protein